MVTAWTGAAKPRLGLQERVSMPLLAYFATIGGALTALLLLLNVMLEPSKPASKPESSAPAATGVETSLRKPRTTTGLTRTGVTTTGFMQSSVGLPARALGAEAHHAPSDATGSSAQAALQPSRRDAAERESFTKAKPRSGRKAATGRRPYRDAGHARYAQQPPNWRSSAEGTLGPH
jgi:hypothetical protein